ncbi:Interferon regulatory factor 8 [Bagarius yarrelli]|uniref:Interferon regulatory factor 8 n=1 Tax=Bagarius yarrelli TaxID=175774 RepID=A0A556V8G7_BAGYA|nr:Interferon regulatory factor 8 [Bagarius yarrelli]
MSALSVLVCSAFAQMMICFYYGGKPVGHTLTTHSDGCRISPCQPPVSNALLFGSDSLQTIRFPPVELIENERQRHVTRKLFGHLERGVLLRANREGIFIKRLCQSRVFWSGPDSQYSSGVCKLERDAVVKITSVKCQQLLDAVTAHRAQYSSNLEVSDELPGDQMARIYQDICNYSVPQRPPCYRDNLPIIA